MTTRHHTTLAELFAGVRLYIAIQAIHRLEMHWFVVHLMSSARV